MTNEELLLCLDYLAWCDRCHFKNDYLDKFIKYGMNINNWEYTYSRYLAVDTFQKIFEKGIVYTYQQFINDKETLFAIVHAYKVTER